MGRLIKEIKNFIYLFIYLFILTSCSDKINRDEYVKNNFQIYDKVYKIINDSLVNYCDSALKEFTTAYTTLWEIDSLVIINSSNDKLVATINFSIGKCSNCSMDQVSKILGKKINGKWYFFMGGEHLAVPRDMFGKDEMHPLSFYELSQISRKNTLAGAVIKKNGTLIIDDKWVDNHFYQNGFGVYNNKDSYDSIHWVLINNKWKQKIDTNEYKPLQRKQFKKVNS